MSFSQTHAFESQEIPYHLIIWKLQTPYNKCQHSMISVESVVMLVLAWLDHPTGRQSIISRKSYHCPPVTHLSESFFRFFLSIWLNWLWIGLTHFVSLHFISKDLFHILFLLLQQYSWSSLSLRTVYKRQFKKAPPLPWAKSQWRLSTTSPTS